jgi:Transposase DDE domain
MTLFCDPLSAIESFTAHYRDLFHDARLYKGFQATITGILASGTTSLRQIARAAPQTGIVAHSERRIRRLVHNQNQRADLNVSSITSKITMGGAKRLAGQAEVKVILDGSDLRKPYSTNLEFLSTVRALNGDLIPGYPTLNAIGIGANGVQALLYHKTFSPLEPEFKSEREEVKVAIEAITTALRAERVGRITWILDRGFDDAKVIGWLLETGSCFVIRAQHNRNVRESINGKTKKLFESLHSQPVLGTLEMQRPVMTDGKVRKRKTTGVTRSLQTWLLEPDVMVNAVKLEFQGVKDKNLDERGWVLLTNLPVNTAAELQRVVALYALRWAIEEVFAWTKTALDWEAARVLEFTAFKRLVVFAWLAAAFLFDLEVGFEPGVVQHLAVLGGWVPRSDERPGRRVLCLGLARVLNALLVEHFSSRMQVGVRVLDEVKQSE